MRKTALIGALLLWVSCGCSVNSSPMYLYMTTGEMQRALDERYCVGMEFDAVIEQIEADELKYFLIGSEGAREIEARLMPAGLIRETEPQFGRLLMEFDGDRLASVNYGSPLDDGTWDYTRYRLIECDAAEAATPSEVSP